MPLAINARITFISAGAGSGKTHRLTEILHRELAGKQVRSSGVIATTFTKKAATELRERVREHLLKQGDFALANSIGQARIGTVNSVCGQLVERFAFEAGMATEQQVLEEEQAAFLLSKAMETVMDGPSMAEFLKLVRRLGLDDTWKGDLRSLVTQIRSNDIALDRISVFADRNATDLLSHFPSPAQEDLTNQLQQAIQEALPTIEQQAIGGGKKNTSEYLALLRGANRMITNGAMTWSEWVKLSKSFPEASLKATAEPISALAGRVAEHPDLHVDIRKYLTQMFDLAVKSLEIYAKSKRELGALDFADQEHQLLKLLDNPTVSEVLSEELDLLMVDEFQDTNPIQLALFLKLAHFAKQVYWVGDIKQAIYGFRGSDTELMKAIVEELPALGGTKEILPDSWRSRPELVHLVNAIFSEAFSNSLPREEVELKPVRAEQLSGPSFANWILGGKNAGQEAAALAAGIRKLVESKHTVVDKEEKSVREVRFCDIAILSRSHNGVQSVSAALKAAGIPSATAQPGLLSTPEATLAMACLRRLNDSGDTIATAEIASLSDCMDPEQWVADRLRYLAAGHNADEWLENDTADVKAHPLLARIASLRSNLPLMTPKEALETVISYCDLPAKVVRWSVDPEICRTRLANLEALLELATRYEELANSGQHAASISGFILWIEEISASGEDMLANPAIDAVKVMTHHAAKGLEWPVVILLDMASSIKDRLWSISAQSSEDFNVNNPLKGRFIRYWPWPFGMQQKVGVADAIALSKTAGDFRRDAVEESKRLLYVSMTRARDLMILARSGRKPSGEWLDSVSAPWLLPQEGMTEVQLPTGASISTDRWELDAESESVAPPPEATIPSYWFETAISAHQRLPLSFNPSKAGNVSAQVTEKSQIGERIQVRDGTDMIQLGHAIHACIALSVFRPDRTINLDQVERILQSFSVADCVSADKIIRQTKAMHDWISARWPNSVLSAEHPVQNILQSGQILNGRIDLLIDTGEGWILIDHKSSQSLAGHWEQLGNEYAAQLASYRAAIESASNRPVLESWLFLPVAGGAVKVDCMPIQG